MKKIELLRPENAAARHFLSIRTILNYLLIYSKNFEEGRRILRRMSLPYILGEIEEFLKAKEKILGDKSIIEEFNVWWESKSDSVIITDELIRRALFSLMLKIDAIAMLEHFLMKIFLIDPLFPKEEVKKIVEKFNNIFRFTEEQNFFINQFIEKYYDKQESIAKDLEDGDTLRLLEEYLEIDLTLFEQDIIEEIKKNVRVETIPLGILFIISENAPKKFLEKVFGSEKIRGKATADFIAIKYPKDRIYQENFENRSFRMQNLFLEEFFHLLYKNFYKFDIISNPFFNISEENIGTSFVNYINFENIKNDEIRNEIKRLISIFIENFLLNYFLFSTRIMQEIIDKFLSYYYTRLYISPNRPIPRIIFRDKEEYVKYIKKLISQLKNIIFSYLEPYFNEYSNFFIEIYEALKNELRNIMKGVIPEEEIMKFFYEIMKELGIIEPPQIYLEILKKKEIYEIMKKFRIIEPPEIFPGRLGITVINLRLKFKFLKLLIKVFDSIERLLLSFSENSKISIHTLLRFLSFCPLDLWPFIIDNLLIEVVKSPENKEI